MPNPNAVVSGLIRLDPPIDARAASGQTRAEGVTVELENGRKARLDPADPRTPGHIAILDGLRQQRLPVYLEIDPDSTVVTRLIIPHVSPVLAIRPLDDGVYSVELAYSQARHLLRQDQPDFDANYKALQEALRTGTPVILSEDDAHVIVDVRPFRPGPDGPPPPPFEPYRPPHRIWPFSWIAALFHWIWSWWFWPWRWFRCCSMRRAQKIFDAMSATSCDPLTVPVPCIPFLYPDDGCWGRAHEMCRLMIAMGRNPAKVWIRGSLHAATRNNPNCAVYWGWHVAPTICVCGPRWFTQQDMVIDPSLFTTPVTKATWKSVQGDPAATLTDTDASIFIGNSTDPSYVQCNQVLATYRLQLLNRSLLPGGPPPYAHCP